MQACRLVADDLACRRGDRLLFRGVTLALGPGEGLQIAGPNGTGKSSLLRLFAGLLPAFAGNVARVGACGLVDERAALEPHLPLARALAFWNTLDRSVHDHAERVGLADLLDVPVRYLSTGQRKRAALARLLGQGAPIWLLDEPLNGLDRHGAELVEALVAEHLGSGGICLAASHQPITLGTRPPFPLTDFAA